MKKKIIYISLSLLLAGGIILTCIRWNAWFVEPSESCDEVIECRINTLTGDTVCIRKLLILGDIQDRDMLMAEETKTILQTIVDREKPQLILQTGDMFERQTQASWNRVALAFNDIMDSIPLVVALGNHDYHKGLIHKPDKRMYEAFGYFGTTDIDNPAVAHFVLVRDTLDLFILDSNRGLTGLFRQSGWLNNELQSSTAHFKILALHHPMRSEVSWWNNLFVRLAFEGLVERYGVQLVVCGHDHYYSHRCGDYHQIVAHFSKKEYDGRGESGRHYSMAEIVGNSLRVKVFDDAGKMVEQFAVK